MRNLGYLYEDGKGVTKDVGMALQWYRKAAALKDDDAIKAVARLEQTVAPPPQATRGGAGPVQPPPPPAITPTTIDVRVVLCRRQQRHAIRHAGDDDGERRPDRVPRDARRPSDGP